MGIINYPSTLKNPRLLKDGKNASSIVPEAFRLSKFTPSINPSEATTEEINNGLLAEDELRRARIIIAGLVPQVETLSETVTNLVEQFTAINYRSLYQEPNPPSQSVVGAFNSGEVRDSDSFLGNLDDTHEIVNRLIYRRANALSAVLRIRLSIQIEFAKQVTNSATSGSIGSMSYYLVRRRGSEVTFLSTTTGASLKSITSVTDPPPHPVYKFFPLLTGEHSWNRAICGADGPTDTGNGRSWSCPTVGTYVRATHWDQTVNATVDFSGIDLRAGDLITWESHANAINGFASIRSSFVRDGSNPVFELAAV